VVVIVNALVALLAPAVRAADPYDLASWC